MRLANVDGRATLLISDSLGIDVATVSNGDFGPDLADVYDDWDGFPTWADSAPSDVTVAVSRGQLGSPSPRPRQILAVGLNYSEHAAETGFGVPDAMPPTFTKPGSTAQTGVSCGS